MLSFFLSLGALVKQTDLFTSWSYCFIQVWFQFLHRWLPTDFIARKFSVTEQPSLNPRAYWVSTQKWLNRLTTWNWCSDRKFLFLTLCRMGLLSPPSTFNFPMSGGDGQSLQRHRSTSTPNVHMVSTVDLATISGMEVSGHTVHLSKNILVFELLTLTLLCS